MPLPHISRLGAIGIEDLHAPSPPCCGGKAKISPSPPMPKRRSQSSLAGSPAMSAKVVRPSMRMKSPGLDISETNVSKRWPPDLIVWPPTTNSTSLPGCVCCSNGSASGANQHQLASGLELQGLLWQDSEFLALLLADAERPELLARRRLNDPLAGWGPINGDNADSAAACRPSDPADGQFWSRYSPTSLEPKCNSAGSRWGWIRHQSPVKAFREFLCSVVFIPRGTCTWGMCVTSLLMSSPADASRAAVLHPMG